jgi:pSer/pThr/pTyr-binding forkhead associated (FHA) protein
MGAEQSGSDLGGRTPPDPAVRLLIAGRTGLWAGLRKVLKPGSCVTVGRSRGCDVSLRRAPGFVSHDDPTGVFHSEQFRKVSRVHCEVELTDEGEIHVRDISRNGVVLDGERVVEDYILDPDKPSVALQLGDPAIGVLDLIRKQA